MIYISHIITFEMLSIIANCIEVLLKINSSRCAAPTE